VTIGSILVPALLSIQYTNGEPFSNTTFGIYWTTWVVSLLVTMANGFYTMFKFDKKYFLLHASFEQLKTEGWQYLALTGHYKAPQLVNGVSVVNSHTLQFHTFCQAVERIRMRQMEEEYIKLQDVNGTSSSRGSSGTQGAGQVPSNSDIPNLMNISQTPGESDLVVRTARLVEQRLAASQIGVSIPPPPQVITSFPPHAQSSTGMVGGTQVSHETQQETPNTFGRPVQTGHAIPSNGRATSMPVYHNMFAASPSRRSLL
jgi:hypothetical protein